MAILLRGSDVARWLQAHGIDVATVLRAFEYARWPLDPPMSRPGADEPDPTDANAVIDVWLSNVHLGQLGSASADARLVTAILSRKGRVGQWLTDAGISAAAVETAYPGSAWR